MNKPPTRASIKTGVDLFNRGHFFDAHEVLEDLWRAVPRLDRSRRHFQGLVQLAVAFHHQTTGNLVGAQSVLERGLRNLDGADRTFPQLDLDRLRDDLEPWLRYLEVANATLAAVGRDAGQKVRRPIAPKLPQIMRSRIMPRS
jgi:predicted metal-dependent hydrolase